MATWAHMLHLLISFVVKTQLDLFVGKQVESVSARTTITLLANDNDLGKGELLVY